MEQDGSSFKEWTDNHKWFRSSYQRLARSYDGENVCVYHRRVVDHDRNLQRLLKRVQKKYPQDRLVVEFVSP